MDKSSGKQVKNKGKRALDDDNGGKKKYFCWTLQEELELANILRDERNLGKCADNGWKKSAMMLASSKLSSQFKKTITADNVRNRVKLWKKYYGIVSDILAQSGFGWDGSKQMITVDDDAVWKEYVKSHEDASQFRFKVVSNWDDIVDLCAKDRATGEGAETAFDAEDNLVADDDDESVEEVPKNDGIGENSYLSSTADSKKKMHLSSTISVGSQPSKKVDDKKIGGEKKGGGGARGSGGKGGGGAGGSGGGGEKKEVIQTLDNLVTFVKDYFGSRKSGLDAKEVIDVVSRIPGLSESEVFKACSWLVENEKHFHMLKLFADDKKKGYLLSAMPREQ